MLKIKGKSNVITTFPDNIIDEGGNTNKYVISGSIEQTSIPTPTNPVTPIECGDLVTSGEHQGKYQIPINVNGTTSYIYLDEPLRKIGIYSDIVSGTGSVVRRICKYEITGDENVQYSVNGSRCGIKLNRMDDYVHQPGFVVAICSHFKMLPTGTDIANIEDNSAMLSSVWGLDRIWFRYDNAPDSGSSENNILKFLKDQYNAGTPVTIWVATVEEITSTTTAPTLTLINGSNNISINTTLAPSMMRINYNVEKLEESSYTEFPAEYTSNEGSLSKYSIDGNMSQTGTPTPNSPITPIECGDKTPQLITNVTFSQDYLRFYVDNIKTLVDTENTFTLSFKTNITLTTNSVYLTTPGYSSRIVSTISGTGNVSSTFTLTETDISNIKNSNGPYFHVYKSNTDFSASTDIMLNIGSSPLPYEPYGYRIPIETNKIYLNEPLYGIGSYKDNINGYTGECIRQIKKLVLTGQENWTYESAYTRFYTSFPNSLLLGVRATPAFCTHYQVISDGRPLADTPYNSMYSNSVNRVWFFKTEYTNIENWKAYLAQQHTNGTPVTVWYILETPIIETITLPINSPSSIKGYLTQSTTPTPTNPVYPTYNGKLKSNNKYEIFNTNGSEIGNTNYIYTKEPIRKIGDYGDTINNDGSINRIIKKKVLTGDETFTYYDTQQSKNVMNLSVPDSLGVATGNELVFCTHLPRCTQAAIYYEVVERGISTRPNLQILFYDTAIANTPAGFKSYLAQQYDAGTPVTIWYILATPTTDTTITTPPTINTNKGLNTININTNLLPSKLTITYPIGEWIETYYNKLTNYNTTSDTLPISFNSDSNSLGSISIKGNMIQSTTPSPTSPIMPSETGDKTRNLFDTGSEQTIQSKIAYDCPLTIGQLYTFTNCSNYVLGFKISDASNSHNSVQIVSIQPNESYTFTMARNPNIPEDKTQYFFIIINSVYGARVNDGDIMLNSGSSALSYEPYGYKLDISSGGENLFDGTEYPKTSMSNVGIWYYAADLTGSVYRIPCKPDTTYTLYLTQDVDITIWRIRDVSTDDVPTAQSTTVQIAQSHAENVPSNKSTTFTTSQNARYILFQSNATAYSSILSCIMLIEGSTAKPYSPYNRTTTPIYLGEVGMTRKIKKLVLTGKESWNNQFGQSLFGVQNLLDNAPFIPSITAYSTHFKYNPIQSGLDNAMSNGEFALQKSSTIFNVFLKNTDFTSTTDFKAWLASQYDAGTPVTVWYVLADEETGIVNEPIRKIGNYVDTINIPKSTISIPTVIGTNIIDINTTLKPSEVTIETKQWKPTVPKKYNLSSNTWNYDWNTFRELVRSGNAEKVFPIGTILYEEWGNPNSTAYQIVAYNKHFDSKLTALGYTYSVTLCQVFVTYGVPFDCVEAMLAITKAALPPGKYKFTIPNYDASYGGNKTYHFETTKNVPVGGQVCLEWRYQTVPRTIRTYSTKTSIDALESYGTASSPLPEWNETDYPDDIDLGTVTYSTTATQNTYGIFNHIHRARYGSNNYYQSRIRQYMNGTTNWWNPQTIFDRPVDWNITTLPTNGLLSSMNADFLNVLATPTISSVTNQIFEYASLDGTTFTPSTSTTVFNTYDVNDKIFLLSHTEVNLSTNPNIGSVLDYYTNADNAKRIKYDIISGTRSITGDVTNVGAVENPIITGSTARYWWFRTPYPSYAYFERRCTTSGALDSYSVYIGRGCVPACVIQ